MNSANMKIHSMMSIINFKFVSSEKNLYNWLYDDHLLFVKENHDINDEWKSFYIKKLLDHHLHHYECDKQIIKYLIKWTDYELKFNEWYRKDLLDSVVELMLEYKICQNSNLNWISYFHKLLVMSKIEFSDASTNLSLKKQCCKSKQTAWYSFSICVLNEAHDFSAVRMQLCSLILSTLIHSIFLIQSQLCIY